MQNDIGIF